MLKRENVKVEETWDLSAIYKNVEEFNKNLEEFIKKSEEFNESYDGKIKSVENLISSLENYSELMVYLSKIGAYISLPIEADTQDMEANERYQKSKSIISKAISNLSFYKNELLSLSDDILEKGKENKEFKSYINNVIKQKPYTLSTDVEKALASISSTLEYPYQLYNDTKFRDMRFPSFEVSGKKYDMSYNSFEGSLENDSDIFLRREAFKVFSDTIKKYQSTISSGYNAQVQMEKQISDLRGYKSVFEYLLQEQDVSIDLYNRQIDVIMKELSPHMRKYANLIKRIHNLDEIRYCDLKIEIDPTYSPDVSYEQAKKYVLDGLSILGEDYISIMKEAFNNRWIDYAENVEKRTGAFCSSPYGTNSYILMSFNNKMNEVMTLAHELGHAGHFTLAGKNQNILNTESSMYFVEAPSTTNELIVENHLLEQAKEDKRLKRWVLSQMVSKTYYHNFVTHFMEAAYQREVYKLVDKGEFLDAEKLNSIFKSKLEEFWGDSVIFDDGAELTWTRQPHYYMGLYPYTYSAGLTIGTQVALRIREKGEEEAQRWIEVLKLGGSLSPQELSQKAGVDISTDKPLKDTIAYIGSLIDEIEVLSKELGEI